MRAILSDRDFALVYADVDEPLPGVPPDAPLAAGTWGYLRMRRLGYTRDELERWMERIRGQGWEDAFVFFKHEDEAAGPAMAKDFLSLAPPSSDGARDPE